MNGAFFNQSGGTKQKMLFSRKQLFKSRPGTYVTRLTRFPGALNCYSGKEC